MNDTAATPYARNGIGKLVGAAISMGVILVFEILSYYAALSWGWDDDLTMTGAAAVAGLGMCLILGGREYLRPRLDEIFEAFKYMWWILAISFVFMVWDMWDYVASGYTLASDWLPGTVYALVFCLCIGFSEEAQFRVLATGGILARGGSTKKGIWLAIILGAFYFGQAHIYWSDVFSGDVLTMLQSLLKMLQTGMYAVMLAALMLKGKSIWGIALVHCIDDYLLFVSSSLFGDSLDVEYVSTGSTEEAMSTIIFYLIVCALYLPTLIKAIRTINAEIDAPQFGPFVKERDIVYPGQPELGALSQGMQGMEPQMPGYAEQGYQGEAYRGQGLPTQGLPQQPYVQGQPYGRQAHPMQPQYQQPGYPQQPYGQQAYQQQPQAATQRQYAPYAPQSYGQQPYPPQAYQQGYAPQPFAQQPYAPSQGYPPSYGPSAAPQVFYYPIPQPMQSELPNSTIDPASWQQASYPQPVSWQQAGYPQPASWQQAGYPQFVAGQQASYPQLDRPASTPQAPLHAVDQGVATQEIQDAVVPVPEGVDWQASGDLHEGEDPQKS